MAEYVLKRDLSWIKAGEVVTLGAPIPNGSQWIEHGILHRADLIPILHASHGDPIAYLTDHRLDLTLERVA